MVFIINDLPSETLGLSCSWLTCNELLKFFRLDRALVQAHRQPQQSSSTSSSSSWVSIAWLNAQLALKLTGDTLMTEVPNDSKNARERHYPTWKPLFPDIDDEKHPEHFSRLALSATPNLRHLKILLNTRSYHYQPGMVDVLNLVPNLRSLILAGEADDCTDQFQLYIPLPAVLSNHPLLHSFECNDTTDGAIDLCIGDILAIASHPGLVHIKVKGMLHCQYLPGISEDDDGEDIFFKFDSEPDRSIQLEEEYKNYISCASCSTNSVTARLSLMRYLQTTVSEEGMEVPAASVEAIQNLIKQLELEDEAQKLNQENHSSQQTSEQQTKKRKLNE